MCTSPKTKMLENKAYLSDQLITYIGNKRALLPFILGALERVKADLGKEKLRICDIFSGSGVVARAFKAHASLLIANDLEGYCQTLNRCYLSSARERDGAQLQKSYDFLLHRLQQPLEGGIISELYAPSDLENIMQGERVFYTPRNAKYIDTARRAIAELDESIQPFFLAPLLSEASVKANTSGVFKGFYKNSATGRGQFGGNSRAALSRICADIALPFPVFSNFDCETQICR
ncbi:MAG: DNA adenine methylase, partial [Angelakisella sp.]